ncbi:amino acid adenylation domain-containing protein [Nonomuraea sp. NPDC005692]|uniref:non-ribosomal peptide synthetase n=1 Tax=Nonomuraea sp. NPDC005692 TaxID=3157168 RepID=UPI0033FDD92D
MSRSHSVTPPSDRFVSTKPFPLTSVQQSYVLGRRVDEPAGGVGCHMYVEFDGHGVEPERLDAALIRLQARHPLLRTAFSHEADHGTPLEGPVGRLTTVRTARPDDVRDHMTSQILEVDRGQVMDIRLSLLPGGATRLHLDVDLLAADPPSLGILLADLTDLYLADGTLPPLHYDFTAYREANPEPAEPDIRGWERLTKGRSLQPPQFALLKAPLSVSGARFTRRDMTLSPALWEQITRKARAEGLSGGSVLLAAYAHTLGRWSQSPDFLLNLPSFDRSATHPDAQRIVGDFTRLNLLSIAPNSAVSLRQLAQITHQGRLAAMSPRLAPAPAALRRLWRERHETVSPVGVVFTDLLDVDLIPDRAQRCFGRLSCMITQTSQVWLDCLAQQEDGGVRLSWDAAEEIFPPGMLDGMTEYCGDVLAAFATSNWDDKPPVHLPAAQRRTRALVNDTRRAESGWLLHERFFALAASDPDEPALIGERSIVSRGTLADRALRVAGLLRSRGVRAGEPVAVSLADVIDQIAAVLGILAAGACYVPIGPDQPSRRHEAIRRTAGVRLTIGDRTAPGQVTLEQAAAAQPLVRPVAVPASSLAYIIFTSGSTGSPKGVEISHRSAVNTVEDINDRWSVDASDRGIAISALDFDLSVYEIFGPLMAGGAVVIPGAESAREPQAWVRLLRDHSVTVWDSVPVLLDMLITTAEETGQAPSSLRLVLTGGDWISMDLPGRLHALVPGCVFVGCGGATEGAIYSNYFQVDRVDPQWPSIPYGRPLGNQRYRVVDEQGRDRPEWVTGEMWIGGAGVARGYRNDPSRTAERFVEHGGQPWYRTGDLGRYWPDGLLEFQGRADHQVKINGFRIELGEIEAVLAAHPAIARAVAVAAGLGGSRRLIAYLLPAGETMDIAEIKRHTESRLPQYAWPAHYLVLPEFPLGSNGKVDRQALAAWGAPEAPTAPAEPPQGRTEETLAEEWSRILGRPVTSRHDRFFDLGGDSLRAMRLSTAVGVRFGREIPFRALLQAATVAGMAELVTRSGSYLGER